MFKMIVRCTECGQEHDPEEVKFLNVEEDAMERDKLYFECPVTEQNTWSYVIRK